MRLGQTSVIYFISKFSGSILGFIATIYFTRTLGEEIYGFYALTLALVSWLGIVKSVGFGQAVVKRMSENEEPDAFLSAGIVVKGGLTTLVVIGIILFRDQVNSYVGQPVAAFVVLLLVVSVLSGLVNSALKGSHRVHIYAPLSTAKEGAESILMITFVYIGWELSGMLLGNALGIALISFVGLWFIKPNLVLPQWRHVVSLFDFAKFSWLGSMRKKTFNDTDILVLGLFVSSGLTGVYAIAYAITEFLDIFSNAIRNSLFPELSQRAADNDATMIRSLTNVALSYTGLFLIPGVVGSVLLGDRLMRIYGDGFEIGAQVLPILVMSMLIYSYTKQLLNTLNGIDRPDLAFRANAVFIFSNVVLNLVLVYSIGWVGAAIATATSAGIGFIFGYHYTRRHVAFTIPFVEITRQWTAALGMGVVVYIVREFGEANWTWIVDYNAIFVVGLVGLGAVIYFTLLLGISPDFRTTVRSNLPFDIWFLNR